MSITAAASTTTAAQNEGSGAMTVLTGDNYNDPIFDGASQRLTVENHDEPRIPSHNPSWWPTAHRRMPDYRQARYHPEWHELTDNSSIMPMFVLVLFVGCHIISVGEYDRISRLSH